ncbi:AGAP009027-PA-like protein [Anopheles sinensis]|uniref:AGAP009027-PA-like protein n=1 Tax=Anopheles sinensis TaxID=74873 RepID=A0A084VKN2_ANOSI|nr:AGAP009027-PA-like protein [Anopheles sinensis]
MQAELGLVVGHNITDEHRWKAIVKDKLQRVLRPVDEKEAKLVEMLQELESEALILIEYVPEKSSQEDVFLVYADVREINEASDIVRKLELLQRLRLNLFTERVFKKRWPGECTDREIESWKRVPKVPEVTTEAVSLYPVRKGAELRLRTANDVRDGFVELLPVKWKTKNMPRKLTDQGTQVRSPATSRFVQTGPSFPTNAATQYLFDASESHIDPSRIPREWLDNSTKSLSKEAQFNLIDLYKNEYHFGAEASVQKYQTPRIDEVLSFMNRSICAGRIVCSMDWHPELSGVFVASYTFETLATLSANEHETSPSKDIVHRVIFEKCPILMWTFTNPLEPLLELKTIRDVTTLSFCPYDGDLLVGGLANGQIALWDLKGEIERVEMALEAARESNEYRKQIRQLMENGSEESIDRTVAPAALSSLEHASRKAISSIKWLPRNYCCTTTGHLKAHSEKLHRFLVTSSLDGSVCFWDLDFSIPALQKMIATKKAASKVVEKTIYQCVNNVFYPTFKLLCHIPITTMLIDEAVYLSQPEERGADIMRRIKHQLKPFPNDCTMTIKLGTLTGSLLGGIWEGYDFEQGSLVTDEPMQVTQPFSHVHDGPIVALEWNPTLKDTFLSIGGHVLALWSETDCSSAIFWRKKSVVITAGRWSLDRPAVFFIGLANGDFEVWDLNMKTFRACISLNLGAEGVSIISQHRLASARQCLAIADGNANVRILSLASALVNPIPNEERTLRETIKHELARKKDQQAWTEAYNKRNPAQTEVAESKPKENEKEKRTSVHEAMPKNTRDNEKRIRLSDRLEQQYRTQHFQTLLGKLMQRRNVSPERMAREMRPEVERRKYDAEKRSAVEANISKADGDFVNLQRVLLQAEKMTPDPVELKRDMLKFRQNIANYSQVEAEAQEVLRGHYLPEMENFTEVLMKGHERRDKVGVKVGTNMEHLVSYENKRSLRRRGLAPRTLLEDIKPLSEVVEESNETKEEKDEP